MNGKVIWLLFLALPITIQAIGQELIPNGGFETYRNCPKQDNLLTEATPWYNPNKATPDFYNYCFPTNQIELPPHSGKGLARLFMDSGWAEYLATPLKQPLVAGEAYQFEMYISSPTPDRYPSGSFGAYISTQPLTTATQKDLLIPDEKPQLLDNRTEKITKRFQWERVAGCFVAKGGENYVTIGNFVQLPMTLGYYYLFIDDVSLRTIQLNLGNDTTLCGRKSTYLLDADTPGASEYKWNTGSTSSTLLVTKPGKYWVTVTTPCKVLRDTITINYKLDFSLGPDTTLCEGQKMTLRVSQSGVYRWQDGTAQNKYEVTHAGLYTVQVSEASCTISDTIRVRYVLPPRLELGADKKLCGTEIYTIEPAFSEGTFQWLDSFSEIKRMVNKSGIYSATVSNDCATIRDSIVVDYSDCECVLYAPDAFSPNADGVNDVFQPFACGDITFSSLTVYNRWGELIFQTNSPPFTWDGTYKGEHCTTGVYVWRIDYRLTKLRQSPLLQTKESQLILVQ
jgi:gliding motility-associated-like protein